MKFVVDYLIRIGFVDGHEVLQAALINHGFDLSDEEEKTLLNFPEAPFIHAGRLIKSNTI